MHPLLGRIYLGVRNPGEVKDIDAGTVIARPIARCWRWTACEVDGENDVVRVEPPEIDVAIEALRDDLRMRRGSIDELWRFPTVCRVTGVMRPYLEALSA